MRRSTRSDGGPRPMARTISDQTLDETIRRNKVDHRLAALTSFKDFTNYLLVTTVAATGWVATQGSVAGWLRGACTVLFALSAIFGIFTLALIPPVAEMVRDNP